MWICEEASGADLAASSIRTPSGWLVGTLAGVLTSEDGCQWNQESTIGERYIHQLVQDVDNPNHAWAATDEGVWLLDGLDKATFDLPVDFSLRHIGQREDGTFILVGFDGPTPIAEVGGTRLELPAKTGRIEVLTSDEQGRFYLRFPAGLTDRLVRVSETGAEVLIAQTNLIRDVASIGPDLYVLYQDGTSWSFDDGASWTPRAGEPIRCLVEAPAGFYACPSQGGGPALFFSPNLDSDPSTWTWQIALNFDEVNVNTCEPGTTAGNQCPYLWRVAGVELGVLEPSSDEEIDSEASSCAGGKPTSSPPLLLLVLGLLWAGRNKKVQSR